MNVENSKNESKNGWGGAREGAGRPKGSMNKATKEKKALENALHEKIMESLPTLFQSQLHIASGIQYLYKIEKNITYGKPKKDGTRSQNIEPKPPKLVTDQWEIEFYLNEVVSQGTERPIFGPEDTYYFITTQLPNNQAINSMIDRVFGKAKQSHSHEVTELPAPLLGGISNTDDDESDTED